MDLNNKIVLITGGTGSFGQHCARKILQGFALKKLIIFSRDELKQFEMANDPLFKEREDIVRFFIGDVRDLERLDTAFQDVDIVIHAAALKHVPIAEYNPFECIQTNVLGAENVVKAALRNNVEKVVALSTDKASNPINLYGASKLASDKIFIAANNIRGSKRTIFSVVRYGNVIGSRGSVVPFFKKIIQEGQKELPITDPKMTRFWISIEQGVNFVIHILGKMVGGEIFVPKIPSMSIVQVAELMAPQLEHKIIGLRPGEKIHESLISVYESLQTLESKDLYIIKPSKAFATDPEYKNENFSDLKPVQEEFSYTSDNNDLWLTKDEFFELISCA